MTLALRGRPLAGELVINSSIFQSWACVVSPADKDEAAQDLPIGMMHGGEAVVQSKNWATGSKRG